jgi:hypothetical protein
LAASGTGHSRATFRRWLERDYTAGECRSSIAVAGANTVPMPVPRGKPFGVKVRCSNTSAKPWLFNPGNNAGIHAGWTLRDCEDRPIAIGRSGLFHATVPPGGEIGLTLSLPRLESAGRYHLCVDMEDERHAKFFQEGSEPLFVELEVP